MKRAVVTGAAGFIGSHLCERLIAEGFAVTGVDAFTPYYDRADKLANLGALDGAPRFYLVEDDLTTMDLAPVLRDAPLVFHLAAQPGVAPIYNVGGGHEATLAEVVALLEELSGETAVLDRRPDRFGDVKRTCADTTRAQQDLGWHPTVALRDGLRSELEWVRARRRALSRS